MKKTLCLFIVGLLLIVPSFNVYASTNNEFLSRTTAVDLKKASGEDGSANLTGLIMRFSSPDDSKSTNLPYKKLNKDELMQMDITETDATKYVNIQRILDEMAQKGQKIEYINGKVVIINSKNDAGVNKDDLSRGNNDLSIRNEDKVFIIDIFENEISVHRNKVTIEEKQEAMNSLMQENPYRTKYSMTFDDGSTVVVEQSQKQLSEINDDSVNTYATVEVKQIDIYGESGFKQRTFTWTQTSPAGIYYQTMLYNYSVLNGNHDIYLNSVIGSSGGAGIFVANSEGAGVDISESHYNGTPTIWTQGHSSYQWMATASVGGTIAGVFNFSVNENIWWTQIQQVAISLSYAHEYCTK
ncbi:MAG: hypothetical protein K0S01_131 [Herbinix sp.]|jgi:hypothetical protein|nr:hypothetical protein [Herbinix sp.]